MVAVGVGVAVVVAVVVGVAVVVVVGVAVAVGVVVVVGVGVDVGVGVVVGVGVGVDIGVGVDVGVGVGVGVVIMIILDPHGECAHEITRLKEINTKLLGALARLASGPVCGCVPCTGQCISQAALLETISEIRDIARTAIAKAEGTTGE